MPGYEIELRGDDGKPVADGEPRDIESVADLPKTATGKIQRFRLREREASK